MDIGGESLLDLVMDEQRSLLLLNDMLMPQLFSPLSLSPMRAEAAKIQNGTMDKLMASNGNDEQHNSAKDREYELSNIVKGIIAQIDVIRPLMADVKNEETVRANVTQLDTLFLNLQTVHEVHVKELDGRDLEVAQQWYDERDKYVFRFKQQVIEYFARAKKEQAPSYKSCSSKSTVSRKTRSSCASSSSSLQAKLIAAKAKAATLKVQAAFLKEKQSLRMAAEELELKQKLAEVEMEEQIYEQELSDLSSVVSESPNGQDCPGVALGPSAAAAVPVVKSTPLNPNAPSFRYR